MLAVEQIRNVGNLQDVADSVIEAVLPGARAMLKARLGGVRYNALVKARRTINPISNKFEWVSELNLAECYYALSLLPTSLLKIQNNGVLIDTSQWGDDKETMSGIHDITTLKQTLKEQGDVIVDSYLQIHHTNTARTINMRVI